MNQAQDLGYRKATVETYARQLREQLETSLSTVVDKAKTGPLVERAVEQVTAQAEAADILTQMEMLAVEAVRKNTKMMDWMVNEHGVNWWRLQTFLMDLLPETIDDRQDFAYNLIPRVLDQVFGKQGEKWHTYRKVWEDSGKSSTYIKAEPPEETAPSHSPEMAGGGA
jgi:uncharacterized protein